MSKKDNVDETLLQIYNTLTLLHEPGEVFEVRVPKTTMNGTMAGYFSDAALAAKAIQTLDGRVPAVYATLNPVDPDLLARCNNRIDSKVQVTTTDSEILSRRWFPLDFDPVRPAGISSTEEEHHRAMAKAEEVKAFLAERGWPAPIEGDSGNGAHLLYRIDMPNDSASTITVQNAIRALSTVFSDEHVSVDHTVFNASRIWKVYGTLSRKGDNTAHRPHRRAAMGNTAPVDVVQTHQVVEIADMWVPDPGATMNSSTGRINDLGDWLERMDVEIFSGPHPLFQGKGKKWVLAKCPFNPAHNKPIVGVIEGRPVFKCLHQSCQSNHWADFRAKIDPKFTDPEQLIAELVAMWQQDPNSLYDTKIADQLGEHSVTYYRKIRERLAQAGVRGLSKLDQAVAAARNARLIREGDRNITNNIYSLGIEIESLQNDGIAPILWHDTASDRIWAQWAGQQPELAKIDSLAIQMTVELHKRGTMWVKKGVVADVLTYKAESNPRNMLKEKYLGYVWDHVPRLNNWLTRYFGVEDNEYTRAVGRKWMISAIARAMEPGSQVDHMLILEGAQGVGKSRAMRVLGGDYHVEYAGSLKSDADHKDMIHTMVGKSIVEISELSAFKGSSIERLKNMLTTTVDDVRLAYRRDSARYPRTCVFAGTTNEVKSAYISDTTGARRFWPVVCGAKIDIEGLRQDRDALWAEAVNAYQSGENWWEVPESTVEEQESRSIKMEDDFVFQRIMSAILKQENIDQGFIVVRPGPILPINRDIDGFTLFIDNPSVALALWAGVSDSPSRAVQQHMYNILRSMGFERTSSKHTMSRYTWRYNPTLCFDQDIRERIDTYISGQHRRITQGGAKKTGEGAA